MEVTVTKDNFETLKNGDIPFVVDFWAEWCGPCKMIAPLVAEMAEEFDGKIIVGKCNVEDEEELAAEMGIRSIPTLYFFKGGQAVDKIVGAVNKTALRTKFEANI